MPAYAPAAAVTSGDALVVGANTTEAGNATEIPNVTVVTNVGGGAEASPTSGRLKGMGISSASHAGVGTAAVVLMVFQIVLVTVLRPGNTGENKRSRRLWNLAHR